MQLFGFRCLYIIRLYKISIYAFSNYQRFTYLKFNSDCTLAEYVNQHQLLADKLELTKCAVTPYQAAMKVLVSLPNEYNLIFFLNFYQVSKEYDRLLDEYEKMERKLKISGSGDGESKKGN